MKVIKTKVSHQSVASRKDIPEPPVKGRLYFVQDEGRILVDLGAPGKGLVEYGGPGGGTVNDGLQEAPKDGKLYGRKNAGWSEVIASGNAGASSHGELLDILGHGEMHISDDELNFITDYVERRPVKPVNLSPADGELEVGEQPLLEFTPYAHPFNLEMYAVQVKINGTELA